MPNTLAHIGINGFLTKSAIKNSDLFMIYLGCILPDVPWIIRKIMQFSFPSLNGYDLQLFIIVQASLFFNLILAALFSFLSKNSLKAFLILTIGVLLHLLIDPMQIKWANGVHLFAPFSWNLTNYGFFWPESFPTYFLTLLGVLFLILNWKTSVKTYPQLEFSSVKILFAFILFLIYFLLPFNFMNNIERNDNHFVGTLKNYSDRTGKYVEFDRKEIKFDKSSKTYSIQSFNKDYIELIGIKKIESNKASVRGQFVNNDIIEVIEIHENWDEFRDGASYIGLGIILIFWINGIKNYRKQNTN